MPVYRLAALWALLGIALVASISLGIVAVTTASSKASKAYVQRVAASQTSVSDQAAVVIAEQGAVTQAAQSNVEVLGFKGAKVVSHGPGKVVVYLDVHLWDGVDPAAWEKIDVTVSKQIYQVTKITQA